MPPSMILIYMIHIADEPSVLSPADDAVAFRSDRDPADHASHGLFDPVDVGLGCPWVDPTFTWVDSNIPWVDPLRKHRNLKFSLPSLGSTQPFFGSTQPWVSSNFSWVDPTLGQLKLFLGRPNFQKIQNLEFQPFFIWVDSTFLWVDSRLTWVDSTSSWVDPLSKSREPFSELFEDLDVWVDPTHCSSVPFLQKCAK